MNKNYIGRKSNVFNSKSKGNSRRLCRSSSWRRYHSGGRAQLKRQ
ncbi:hypothetical protein [Ruminococcus sp.]